MSGRPGWVNWLFADRHTGRIVVVQWPNVPLWTFFAFTLVQHVITWTGTADHTLTVVATVAQVVAGIALAIWAVLEIAAGPNPFRRILGGVVLAGEIAGLVLQHH